jgi:glycosyltransferase involved in cell wall biosynthesis
MKPTVAIFVVTFNRLNVLGRSLESYKHFTTPHEIIIIDNGTENQDSLAYLKSLPYKTYSFDKVSTMDQLEENIAKGVKKYYETNYAPFWAVSDCDICFEGTGGDALDVFIELNRALKVNVGPNILIDNIPIGYPLRSKIIMEGFWPLAEKNQSDFNGLKYIHAPIDTTFCLFNAQNGVIFKRLSNTIRVNKPYAAYHLDWYIDIFNPSPDQLVYMKKWAGVGSFGSSYISRICEDVRQDRKRAFETRIAEWEKKEVVSWSIEPYIISWMYQFGIGCSQNIPESKKWLEKMFHAHGGPLRQIPMEVYSKMIYGG